MRFVVAKALVVTWKSPIIFQLDRAPRIFERLSMHDRSSTGRRTLQP